MIFKIGNRTSGYGTYPARLEAVISLLRPLNVLMFMAGVAVGGLLAAGTEVLQEENLLVLVIAMVSAACIGGAANAINDLFDADIDKVNRPDRPIPSGRTSRSGALGVWAAFTAVGLVLAAYLTNTHLIIAAASAAALFAYSKWLKHWKLAGNFIVAGAVALALLYGGLIAGQLFGVFVGSLFAFLSILAREVIKDIEDVEGDRLAGARSLSLTHGINVSRNFAIVILVLIVYIVPLPYLWLNYGMMYLLIIIPAALFMILAIWNLLLISEGNVRFRAGRASSLIKSAMISGLLALTAAALV